MERKEAPNLDDKIRRQFAEGKEGMEGQQKTTLDKPIEQVLQMTVPQKKVWLDTVRRSREAQERKREEERQTYEGSRRVMRQFLQQEE